MREFEQMQFFCASGDEMKHYEFWKEAREMALILRVRKKTIVFMIMKN
jgi:hypothetical protein